MFRGFQLQACLKNYLYSMGVCKPWLKCAYKSPHLTRLGNSTFCRHGRPQTWVHSTVDHRGTQNMGPLGEGGGDPGTPNLGPLGESWDPKLGSTGDKIPAKRSVFRQAQFRKRTLYCCSFIYTIFKSIQQAQS